MEKKSKYDIWITSGVFSNHYLLECLPQAGAKIWPSDEEALSAYKAIQELYKKNIVGLRKGNEANTERRFIDKVFNELGFGYLNQDKIPEAERRQVPDYFLYSTPEEAGSQKLALSFRSPIFNTSSLIFWLKKFRRFGIKCGCNKEELWKRKI